MTPAQLAAYQLRVNAWALAYAQKQASARRNCLRVIPPTHPSWMCLGTMLDPNLSRYTLNGTLASANVNWSIGSGTLPPGVTLDDLGHNLSNQAIAELAGQPTTPGKYSFTVQAVTGSAGISLNDTLSVFGLISTSLPDATVGTLYTAQLTTAGGTDPVTFSVDPVMIPAWLTVSGSGEITGTPGPTDAGIDFSFDVTMTDAEGGVCTQNVTIKVTGGCPDWNAMVWAPPSSYNCVFTPAPSGNFISILYNNSSGLVGAGFQNASEIQVAGPCNCNIHVSVAAQSPGVHFTIQVANGGVQLNWDSSLDWVGGIPGSNDLVFTLPAPHLYNISIGVFGHNGESCQFTLTFSNVP